MPRVPPLLKGVFRDGQFGVDVRGGIEEVAQWAKLHHEVGQWLIVLGARNAFNSVSQVTVIADIAEHIPALVPVVTHSYCRQPRSRFILMDTERCGLLRTGVRQGDPLGVVLFCIGILPALRILRHRGPPATPAVAYADDIRLAPKEISAHSVEDISTLREDLRKANMVLSPELSLALPPQGHVTPEEQRLSVPTLRLVPGSRLSKCLSGRKTTSGNA